ncbi:MAG: hypothetical protein LBV30_04280 [Propionibacteriaceae bacterium]|jgi:hypothetical protein|nr:hypothetical protein [Propionibacteriaceae bacterium]
MHHTREELTEALRQVESTIAKLEKVVIALAESARAQRTLAVRRLAAFRIAAELIRLELEEDRQ